MTRAAATVKPEEATGQQRAPRWPKPVIAVAALALIAWGSLLPLWTSHLRAPQYPGGLNLIAFGNRVEGDLDEIDALNHYVGMRPFRLEDFPEIALWPVGVATALAAVLVAVMWRKRWWGRLARWFLWFFPISVLAVIQIRLHQFGHDLDPGAAFRMDGFTPWVIGPTKVWNFTAMSMPGAGIWLMLLAAAIVSFGPRLISLVSGGAAPQQAEADPPRPRKLGRSPQGGTNPGGQAEADPPRPRKLGRSPQGGTNPGGQAEADPPRPDKLGRSPQGRTNPVDPGKAVRLSVLVVTVGLLVGGFAAPAYADHEHHGHDHGPGGPSDIAGQGETLLTAVPPRPPVDRLIDLAALIAATPDGETLHLPYAAYRGGVVIDRPIKIMGHDFPLIVGDRTGTVITVTASDVEIFGVQVTGSGPGPSDGPAGIRVSGDNITIEQVVVDDSYMGIAADGATRVRIYDSLILGRADHAVGESDHATGGSHDHHAHAGGRGDAISLWNVDGASIRGTRIIGARDAIYISFGEAILIDSNHVSDSRYGVHTMYASDTTIIENLFEANYSGLVLMYGGGVDVVRNRLVANVSPSTGFGVLVKDVTEVQIVQNVMVANRVGIHIDGPAGGTEPIKVTANTVADNEFGVMLFPSAQAVLGGNSFVDNVVQVGRAGRFGTDQVVWSDRGFGNFWSGYQGYDDGTGMGRGTVAHVEGSSVHRVLTRSPLLGAIATTPAMRLVSVVEERWMQTRPMAIDELPLTAPISPVVATEPAEMWAGRLLIVIGALTVLLAVTVLAGAGGLGRRFRYV